MYLRQTVGLNFEGAMVVLQGAIAKAEEMAVPWCIALVDTGSGKKRRAR